jgi:hypothetical protein
MVTAAPSGNGELPSKTTTPFFTRPGMTMALLFAFELPKDLAEPKKVGGMRPQECGEGPVRYMFSVGKPSSNTL